MKIDSTHIEKELLHGNLDNAIKMMLAILKAHDSSDYNDMILQSAAYNGLQRDINRGLMSDNNAKMNTARITHTVRHYWSKVKPHWTVDYDGPMGDFGDPGAANDPLATSPDKSSSTGKSQPKTAKKVILCLSANPVDSTRLQLGTEFKKISSVIESGELRDQYEVLYVPAVSISDFRKAVLRNKPAIVHFSGHGTQTGEIKLHKTNGQSQNVTAKAIGDLFALFKKKISIECVVLNACYSDKQGKEIFRSIDTVIGMSDRIGDDSALQFSTTFYQTLLEGEDYESAFAYGCNDIDLNNLGEEHKPVILLR